MALKFFRTCLNLSDAFYYDELMKYNIFGPILDIVYETMPRDNLLNSACLELFEFIKRESIRPIIVHLGEKYRQRLLDIRYVDLFELLVTRYDSLQAYLDAPSSPFTQASATPPRSKIHRYNQRWQGVREMDAAEEEYFNTSDDEDELAASKPIILPSLTNGSSPRMKPLVDYPDDDDEIPASAMQSFYNESPPGSQAHASDKDLDASTSPDTLPRPTSMLLSSRTPPERISEKRRREDDEEDELGKLSLTHKRRSSSNTSVSSPTTNPSPLIRRKKSFSNKDPQPGKKIAFTLSVKTPIEAEQGNGKGG